MSAFELYEKYLHNSISFVDQEERAKKILHEKEELNKMMNALDNLFYKDKDLTDSNSRSIYTLMKREMARMIISAGDAYESVIAYYQFYLRAMFNEVALAQVAI